MSGPEELSAEASACLADTGAMLSDLVGSGPSRGTDAALPSLFRSLESLKCREQEQECSVAILAAIKSGKSTLLNALLGDLVLPSNNVPETARIVRVQHAPERTTPLLSYTAGGGGHVEIEGAALVRDHLRHLNAAARSAGANTPGGGGLLSPTAAEAPLTISAPIAALGIAAPGRVQQRVALLDSPGPNEAGQDALKFKVERLLEGVDAVLYVLDYSKLKSSDEAAMLQRLNELNPALIRRLCHRLFFVVNKMDMAETTEGMGEVETRSYVAALVSQQLGVPGFELEPEQIFLVSARDALLSRLVLRPRAAPEDLDSFRRVAFGKRWKMMGDPEIIRETADEMLASSGLPQLEAGVMGFLGTRASLLHLVALLDDHERLLAQVHNLTRASTASLHRGVSELQAETEALQERLSETLGAFEGVGVEVGQLEGLVVDEVRERMARLCAKLEDYIASALTPTRPPVSAPRGRWPAVWAKAKALLGLGEGASGEKQQEELEMKLCELHSMVYEQVEAETRDFWGSLEQSTNQRQRQLLSAINARIRELSAAVEKEVSLSLHCSLEPVDMRLKPPSAEQFHVNLQQLLQRGIQRQERKEEEEQTRAHVVYNKKTQHSLCGGTHEWWEPSTESRTERVEVTRVSYKADLAAIQRYFVGVVEASTKNSVRAVRLYVRAYLSERLAEARGVLQSYANRYTACMLEALEVARQGEAERGAALDVSEAHCAAATALLERVQDLQRLAEELLEGWEGDDSSFGDGSQASEVNSEGDWAPPLEADSDSASRCSTPEGAGGTERSGSALSGRAASGGGSPSPPASYVEGEDEEEEKEEEELCPGLMQDSVQLAGDAMSASAGTDTDEEDGEEEEEDGPPGLAEESMCGDSVGDLSAAASAASELAAGGCEESDDEPPPLLADSICGNPIRAATASAVKDGSALGGAARSSSRAAEVAAAYAGASLAASVASVAEPAGAEEQGSDAMAEVPLQEAGGSQEGEGHAEHAELADGSEASGEDDWTVVSEEEADGDDDEEEAGEEEEEEEATLGGKP